MVIVHRAGATLILGSRANPLDTEDFVTFEVAHQAVVMEMNFQAPTNQARWHTVEHAANINGASTADFGGEQFVVRRPVTGERPKLCFLLFKFICMLGIELSDTVINQSLIVADASKVMTAAQIHRLNNPILQMAMRPFNCAILVGDSTIVARRLQPIVVTQIVIQPRQWFVLLTTQVSVSCAQAIGPVLLGRSAASKQRVLQPFGEGDKAFSAFDKLGMQNESHLGQEVTETSAG